MLTVDKKWIYFKNQKWKNKDLDLIFLPMSDD